MQVLEVFNEKKINTNLEFEDKYDREFIILMLEIEKRYLKLIKQDKLRIGSWIKKLCIPLLNKEWKKSRNLHAIQILDMINSNRIEEPYNKFADETQNLPLLNKTLVKAKLSQKFQEISFQESDKNINAFSKKVFKQFITDEDTTKMNLKNNKMILKKKFSETKVKIIENKLNKLNNEKYNYDSCPPFSFLKKEFSHPYVDQKLINEYSYEREIEKLKKLLINLDSEIKNENKKNLAVRVMELETAIEKIVMNKENDIKITKSIEKVLLKNKNY